MTQPDTQTLLRQGIAAAKALEAPEKYEAGSGGSRIRRIGAAQTRQRDKARQLLLEVIRRDQSNIQAWLWLSTVVDDPAEKRTCLENVLVVDPDNQPAKNGLALLARNNGASPSSPDSDHSACPFCHRSITPLATTCSHCTLALTIDCPACGNRIDVEQAPCPACTQPLGDYREPAAYFAHLAAAYQQHEKPNKALTTWQTVARLDPDYPHLHLSLGQLQAQFGRTEAAIERLQHALNAKPDELPAALALGRIFQQLQQWDEATTLFRRAVAIAPHSAEAQFAVGELLVETGNFRAAQPYLNKATKLDPEHGQAWLRLGQLQDYHGKSKQAARSYEQANRYLTEGTLDRLRSQKRLTVLQPDLPRLIGSDWGEFARQISGPILLCLLAALVDSGLRPWWIPLSGWLAIFMAGLGAFLWVSGTSLPHNPVMQWILGDEDPLPPPVQTTLAVLGLTFWFLAFGIILYPIDQTFPEPPEL